MAFDRRQLLIDAVKRVLSFAVDSGVRFLEIRLREGRISIPDLAREMDMVRYLADLLGTTVREAEEFSEQGYRFLCLVIGAKAVELAIDKRMSFDEALRNADREVKEEAIREFRLSPCKPGDPICFTDTVIGREDYWRRRFPSMFS